MIDALQRTVDTMRTERSENIAGEPPQPSFAALRADALLRLVDGEQADTELVVHASAEVLTDDAGTGCCELDDGSVLAPETTRRLACDAGVVRLLEDAHGEPLDVGRKTRSIPPAIRRALNARDRGCRFPGCDATAHVEGHHIQHWAHGGETKLENLCSLCRFHHRLVHEGGFEVEHRGHGVFRFTRLDGEVLSDTVPRVVLEGCPMDSSCRPTTPAVCPSTIAQVCATGMGCQWTRRWRSRGCCTREGSSRSERGGRASAEAWGRWQPQRSSGTVRHLTS